MRLSSTGVITILAFTSRIVAPPTYNHHDAGIAVRNPESGPRGGGRDGNDGGHSGGHETEGGYGEGGERRAGGLV